MQPELKVRKILGRTYLNENRLAEALDIFIKILVDYPDDLETLLVLGGFYLAAGDGKTAKSIFQRARQLDPGNKTVERQILMAEEIEGDGAEEPVPTDLQAVSRLLQRLTGGARAIEENDVLRAASLLERVVNSPNPAELVFEHLDEIDELMMALIELNIRQAHADGRADVAEGLRSLQLNIDYQRAVKDTRRFDCDAAPAEGGFNSNLLMLLPDLEKKTKRMSLLKSALQSLGCRVSESEEYIHGRDRKPDAVIASNPHTNPALIESLSVLSDAGVPILLDMDTDFENQPVAHQEYGSRGLGTEARGNAYNSAIALADLISVPSEMQAASLKSAASRVRVIPDGWSRANALWEKKPAARSTINIGWVASSGQLDDLLFIRRYMIRILREFPETRVVIIGSPQAYRSFDSLPENRRLYLPLVSDEEFPYLLSQLDVLLVPLRNLPYNLSLPDTILMEAGARGIPWIASPIPSFRNWNTGGILCESLDEWHLNLRHLVMDGELRSKLGKAGRQAAAAREMTGLGRQWSEAIGQAMHLDLLLEPVESV